MNTRKEKSELMKSLICCGWFLAGTWQPLIHWASRHKSPTRSKSHEMHQETCHFLGMLGICCQPSSKKLWMETSDDGRTKILGFANFMTPAKLQQHIARLHDSCSNWMCRKWSEVAHSSSLMISSFAKKHPEVVCQLDGYGYCLIENLKSFLYYL